MLINSGMQSWRSGRYATWFWTTARLVPSATTLTGQLPVLRYQVVTSATDCNRVSWVQIHWWFSPFEVCSTRHQNRLNPAAFKLLLPINDCAGCSTRKTSPIEIYYSLLWPPCQTKGHHVFYKWFQQYLHIWDTSYIPYVFWLVWRSAILQPSTLYGFWYKK